MEEAVGFYMKLCFTASFGLSSKDPAGFPGVVLKLSLGFCQRALLGFAVGLSFPGHSVKLALPWWLLKVKVMP